MIRIFGITFGHVPGTGKPITVTQGKLAGCKGEIVSKTLFGNFDCRITDAEGKTVSLTLCENEFARS